MLKKEIQERFQCSGCGECCRWTGSVLLTETDIPRMAAWLGMSDQDFIDAHTRLAPNRRQLALLDQADGSCAFLAGDRCTIYEARPEQCRTFPFAWSVTFGCPELDRLRAEFPADGE
ncbi:YkgJ family cysteine cluster protein [Pontiella sp.]|uniref:YkgJ family cysteine cluster protein n=1 Tax=Pontiella sp. TaxID=2837462 RepID=UPI003568A62C